MTTSTPNILIVEDDPDHLAILQHYLGKCTDRTGVVTTVCNLREARGALDAGAVDLVLLDLTLPASTMEETIEVIPELASRGASIVALSSLDTPDLATRVLAAGSAGFLAKSRLNEGTLRSILDDTESTPIAHAPATARPQAEPREPRRRPETGLGTHALDQGLGVRDAASRLAHDVSSWLASMSFRLDILESGEAVHSSVPLSAEHITSLRDGLEAVRAHIAGARAAVFDASSAVRPTAIELGRWIGPAFESWKNVSVKANVKLDAADLPRILADDQGLQTVLGQLAQNVAIHASRNDGTQPTMTVRARESEPGTVGIEVVDDGGPWRVDVVSRLGRPATEGRRDRRRAGMGLYRVALWMTRMGGRAEVAERNDAPGAYAVRLVFPSP